jgi:hypothetical protein
MERIEGFLDMNEETIEQCISKYQTITGMLRREENSSSVEDRTYIIRLNRAALWLCLLDWHLLSATILCQ